MGLLRWSNESIKLPLTVGLKGQTILASEDWMMSWFCDPLLLLCCSCMCLSGTLHSQLFPQVAHHRGNITSLIHRNELCGLCLSLFLFLSLSAIPGCFHSSYPLCQWAWRASSPKLKITVVLVFYWGGSRHLGDRWSQVPGNTISKPYAWEICFLVIWDCPPKENKCICISANAQIQHMFTFERKPSSGSRNYDSCPLHGSKGGNCDVEPQSQQSR